MMTKRYKFLFCIRSKVDHERYLAIAENIKDKVDATWAHFSHDTLPLGSDKLKHRNNPKNNRSFLACDWSQEELNSWIRELSPDIIVLDQFGPSASEMYKALPRLARKIGIPSCMIPHGVPTVFPSPYTGPKIPHHVADIVFFANEQHFDHAVSFYGVAGTFTKILGDPRFDIESMQLASRGTGKPSRSSAGPLRIGLFESNVPDCLGADAEQLQTTFFEIVEQLERCIVKVRSHPRYGEARRTISSSRLIHWADLVSTVSSSAVFEGLYFEKPAYVLGVREFSGGKCKSLFETFPNERVLNDGHLPVLKIWPNRRALENACWGGLVSGSVAKQYASVLLDIAKGDLSKLEQV